MIGDHFFRYDPPWPNQPPFPFHPLIPAPLPAAPLTPWPMDRLLDLQNLMRRVKELEDRLGCPCEPNKADYLGLIAQRISDLEKKATELGK